MKSVCAIALTAAGLATVVLAVPPGPIDGENIPSNFGPENLVATQTNHTSFGNYTVTAGALIEGNETDQLYLAKSATKLYVGIKGNLATNGNAWMIGIGIDGRTGQTESRAEGVGGPPFTLQAASREVIVDDSGTPEDPSDDTWSYGAAGTILPCETDYVIAIDAAGGIMYASEYELLDPSITPTAAGTWDPTPDNPNDLPDADLFAFRNYLGSTPTNDGDDIFDDFMGVGYTEGGFDNSNVDGVTDTDGSSAATATTGMEFGIPLSRIGDLSGTETIDLYILMLDGVGEGNGTVVNQVLPPLGAGAPCDPPDVIGVRPDLTTVMACLTVDLSALLPFTGVAEGDLSDPASEGYTLISTQTCPTAYGDQQFDPDGITRTGGSEMDALYVTSDAVNLYIGIAGNLEENGAFGPNRFNIWFDSVEGGEHILTWDGEGGAVPPDTDGNGMEDDALPPLESDTATDALLDCVISMNVTGDVPNADIWVDLWDINALQSTYKGRGTMETGNGDLDTSGGGSNQWGMEVALNNLNNEGVIGCGFFEDPCGNCLEVCHYGS